MACIQRPRLSVACMARGSRRAVLARAEKGAAELRPGSGPPISLTGQLTVGRAEKADVRITGPETFDEHAEIRYAQGRVFVKALNGASRTYLGGVELRAGVSYMVAPRSKLAFGTPGGNELEVVFEEAGQGADAMMGMLMRGMARNDEVRKQLEQ